jgi:hypothetical protein
VPGVCMTGIYLGLGVWQLHTQISKWHGGVGGNQGPHWVPAQAGSLRTRPDLGPDNALAKARVWSARKRRRCNQGEGGAPSSWQVTQVHGQREEEMSSWFQGQDIVSKRWKK